MALTFEQRIARTTEEMHRVQAEKRRLESQTVKGKRAARNHRLIEAAARVEAVAKRYGIAGFEFDADKADKMAAFYFENHGGGSIGGHHA